LGDGFLRERKLWVGGPILPVGVIGLWGVVKLFTHLWLALISGLRPLTALEARVSVWPPSHPWFLWLERAWLAPFARWDVVYYLRIASQGYQRGDGAVQFHPLYPMLAKPLISLGFSPLMALMLVSSMASLLLIVAVYNLARRDLGPPDAAFAALLCIVTPFSFALYVPYSEALFLLCAVLAFYWAARGAWWLAGLAAALATLTRQQGLLLVLPLGWLAVEQGWVGKKRQNPPVLWEDSTFWGRLLPMTAVPLSYGGWLLYRARALNDVQVSFTSLHDFIYSLLISPQAVEVVPVQQFVWPWLAMWRAGRKLWQSPDIDIVVNLVGGVFFLLLVGLSWRYLRVHHKLYVVASTVLSFAYYTGPSHPYMGLLRHLALGFPVFLGVARRVRSSLARGCMLMVGFLGMLFLLLLYGLESWVP
jgi:hypothetical protein